MIDRANVLTDGWDEDPHPLEGWLSNSKWLIGRGHELGLSVYELPPGQTQSPYHFHHGEDELIVVLRGRPTLRTPDGERELAEGDFVHFPRGPSGAHQVWNASDEPARYLVASSTASPEVVEYPDSGKVLAAARADANGEGRLWTMHRRSDAVDYIEGERPKTPA